MIYLNLLFLIGLFYLIGKAADLVIINSKKLGKYLGINIFILGLTLGFLTSLPELFVGLNSLIKGVGQLAIGNLIGGIFVLFGLITGVSIILNREIKLEYYFSFEHLFFIALYIIFPLILLLDQQLELVDGIILIFFYFLLTFLIFRSSKNYPHLSITYSEDVKKSIFLIIIGLIGVVFFSNLIIDLTLKITENFKIPLFLMGLLFFSIGTNLPEIILTIRAWQKQVKSLFLGNIIGSALANILIIGIFSIIKNISITINLSFFVLLFLLILLLLIFISFALSKRKFTFFEGVILLIIYIIFVISQLFFRIS